MSNEWKMVRLGDVGNIVTGNTPKTSNLANYNSQDVCFYKPSDIGETVKFLTDSENKISATALNEARELPISSVLVSCIGIIGKIGILTNKAISNQQINAIIPNEDYDSKFLAYSLLFNRPRLQSIANAPVVPIINKTTFSNFTLFVPSLERQREIAAVLDKASELVEKRKAQLAELDLLAESVFYDMFGDPVTNTKGWEVSSLETICKLKAGDFVKAAKIIESKKKNTYPCYGGNGLRGYVASSTHKGLYVLIGRQGALCGNVKLVNGEFHATEHAIVVTKLIELCESWLYYHLHFMNLNKYSTGAAQPGLSVNTLNKIDIYIPPLLLQQQFAERIEKIEEQKAKVKTALKESENLFQRLMQDMFNPDYHNS